MSTFFNLIFRGGAIFVYIGVFIAGPTSGIAQSDAYATAFRQAVAEAVARDDDLAAFYRQRDFRPIWTGASAVDRARLGALLAALDGGDDHGLPTALYDSAALLDRLKTTTTSAEQGALEVDISRLFLSYARDIQTGVSIPNRVVDAIKRDVPLTPRRTYLDELERSNPTAFFAGLPPKSPEYARLLRAKLNLEQRISLGGWGAAVSGDRLEPSASGSDVAALRDRLVAMGFMDRSASQEYDSSLQMAVKQFQKSNGLTQDGVAGRGTLAELNVPATTRLQQVIVAMERERWMNHARGDRHVWVNLTDFSATIVDNNAVTFRTRSVIGALGRDRESPEFSDVMNHMVINPSWYVPRSIIVGEYLPKLQRDPNAVSHIEITDRNGRVINRGAADFSGYTARTFPYAMRQPPSRSNALGLVKFMFPNQYNIYLHDTPAKSLFGREVRAYSHGCIRLNDPIEFAHALLAVQHENPETYVQNILNSGREARVNLEAPIPVHIVYRTAFTETTGRLNFRRDVYDRDNQIWQALANEGVVVRAIGG